jgi:signal transduction histidine kinase
MSNPVPRVLVVDDEPSVLETMAAILSQEGYEVEAAGSAEDALEHLRKAPFDLVLTDLRMQGASGLSVLAELRRNWPETLAIILTGYASLDSAIDALREGAYDYLIKPCPVEELKATIARALERRALARTLDERVAELEQANATIKQLNDELQQRVDEATAALRQKVGELEETQQQRDEFISMIAHELNQPLTSLRVSAQMLARATSSEESKERARTTIQSATERLSRLVQDLSDAARLAAGRFQIDVGPVDLAAVVQAQAEQARLRSPEHVVIVEGPASGVEAVLDRDRVAQVLSNLLTNAITHTPSGTITITLEHTPEQATVTVRDNGPGIPPDRLRLVFEPYVQLAAGQRNGTGLGLHIARGIVEAHGGRIWVESTPGEGATFAFSLPLAPSEAPALIGEPARGH